MTTIITSDGGAVKTSQDNRYATLAHLELLGYVPGDRVFFRSFFPSGSDKKDAGRKAESVFPNLPPDLRQWEIEGRGVYVVVNGGGHKDADVTECRAIFYEHDDIGKEESAGKWRELGLPEPTFQLDTGGKSVHSHWVLDKPISPDLWRRLQTDLLEFADADRSLKNPSRVMRLAGFKHPKTGVVATISSQSGTRYDYETLRAAIPGERQPEKTKALSWGDFDRSFSLPWSETVPLEVGLSKSNRALLESGISEGGRNSSGAALARDLIGTAAHLQGLGQPFSGDPRWLFEAYCDRCSPPLPDKERESIWKSAESDNPGPALAPDQIEGCVKGWAWRERRGAAPGQPTTVGTGNAPAAAAGAGVAKPDRLTIDQVRQQLERLVVEDVGGADITIAIASLAGACGRPPRTIQEIYRSLLQKSELESSTQDALPDFDDLLKASSQTCDVGALLPSLAGPLGHYAKAFNQESVTFALPLLAVAASLLSPETDLVIGGGTDYRLPPILWGGLVAEPGSIKTPIYKAILQPLVYRQVSAQDEYNQQLEEYEAALKTFNGLPPEKAQEMDKPEKPMLRQYYVDSATTEAVQRIVTSQTDKGLVVSVDELSGFFNGFNQYKSGGKGADRDFWKSAADGGAVKIDRVSGTQFAATTSVSATGTIQPVLLGEQMGAGDPDGFWSRFLWVRLPLNRLPAPGDGPKIDLTNLLHSTYRNLEDLPTTSFHLSPEAKATWRRWHEWCEDRRLSTDTPVERVLYPKYRDRAGRVALVAHCLEYASRGQQPPAEIPNSTLEAAISFVTFCLGQTRLLYSEIGLTSELTGDLLKVHDYLKRKGHPISVADLGRANLFPPLKGRDGKRERNPKNRRDYLLPLLGKLV
ncbi:MAG: hypothetical protein RLZZ597_3797, partial [Cyanobacteriota bacterium]